MTEESDSHPAAEPTTRQPGPRRARARRGPGQRAHLSRRIVLDAAAQLDPQTLTLQSVADVLGVDRKAVAYYVRDRDELLALLGSEALAARLDHLVVPGGDWRAAVRVFAGGMRDAMLREPQLGLYVTHLSSPALLRPSEALAQVLLDAGFDDQTTGRALSLVTAVANESARAQLVADQFGQSPTTVEILRVLDEAGDDELTQLGRILPALDLSSAVRLEFDLEIVLAGLAARLAAGCPAGPTPN